MNELIEFFSTRYEDVFEQMWRHTALTFVSVAIAVVVGIPLGIVVARKERLVGPVLNVVGVLQTIPSIALLGFMIPLFGIGVVPATIALMLYALLPLVRNTYTGLQGVDANVVESARALGMTDNQVLLKVELPLAMPVIFAGIRTATVINVGVATLAAYIGAGGLGEFIFGGIALNNTGMILGGAIPAAVLAVTLDQLLGTLQRSSWVRIRKGVAIALSMIIGAGITIFLAEVISPPDRTSADNSSAGRTGSGGTSETALRAGFTQEFMGRQDGYVGLKEVYGLDMPVSVMSDAVMYKAIAENEVDVISGYTTDGRIASYDLIALADDKKLFPPYYAAPLVRQQTLAKHPELPWVLDKLSGKINDSVMIALNYQVDFLKRTPMDVASEFLLDKGLLMRESISLEESNGGPRERYVDDNHPRGTSRGTVVFGSKAFTEQYTLAHIYKFLIEHYTDIDVELKTGLGGTQICFGALTNDDIDMYVEYTGTGLLVMLKADTKLQASLSTKDDVFNYVRKEFAQRYNVEWLAPLGFNNAYALMMRRQHARALHVTTVSDLVHHVRLRF